MKKRNLRERGQGLVELGLIVVLISALAISLTALVGPGSNRVHNSTVDAQDGRTPGYCTQGLEYAANYCDRQCVTDQCLDNCVSECSR